ncbi:4-hydroxy-tetrahydrodipicolinate reductase [Halalkalibacterium halodurans]|uniref:4-hydroxy-tetrahydrodipicolinate reductase n=1 Tax=Halalkalibacterium halodurans TaxID=86665 RepID=UPI002E23B29F|nr:4-hydroxy-tetrahydrodipicolinate reductase [Halalkalibacterium halodurans]MED4081343.1 4-hydroxy-tetrahydrodipicolinate reductase [Halalkalibacterium halodurans]MED4086882.1 4-hydroxy-tetrahydrodipicolinate reductase [Halalkalibacterium halodurans]MED4104343.1 4-hydroxy-tetrahydrodipicolinate reductase [Halalkalibacterium halodurans]MED4109194.1 4-hydroxy-tetrahydrodipicolinate reductase [Halalkalibacterium halodurans]MED4150769.1 4-hydroxy-tetrahydrodipicolinate reductase [Halalkalibacteri
MIKVAVAGPRGKMGREAVKMIHEADTLELVAVVDSKHDGMLVRQLDGLPPSDAPVYNELERCLTSQTIDVLVDLTTPAHGKRHMEIALDHGVRPVVGTTGFTDEDITNLRKKAEEKGIGAIIAPNFAIGAILMMKFAQTAAKYLPDVEIIEMHHDRKLDAPSGTALKTAQLISEVREAKQQGHPDETEELKGARGADFEGMSIHSVRLPGLVAHQEVLFGGVGQTLKIRHDSMNRESFMPGVKLSIETVMGIDTLVYGLENIIE